MKESLLVNPQKSSLLIMEEGMKAIDKKKTEVNNKKKYEKPEIKKHRSISIISGSCSYYGALYNSSTYYY